jgi:hypothetical protein
MEKFLVFLWGIPLLIWVLWRVYQRINLKRLLKQLDSPDQDQRTKASHELITMESPVVHIYGDPDKLHPNLRNSFENLCKRVVVHKGGTLQ